MQKDSDETNMKQASQVYLAHIDQDVNGEWRHHDLLEHLSCVANLAAEFASEFDSADWAYFAGLWHDLGKYSKDFQQYIRNASGYDLDAHLEDSLSAKGKMRVNHSSAGAIHADKKGRLGRILSYLIAGHHAGLPDWSTDPTGAKSLSYRLQDTILLERAINSLDEELKNKLGLEVPLPTKRPPKGTSASLWIRMLFSCLVDADFLDTERFMNPIQSDLRGNFPDIEQLLFQFTAFMKNKCSKDTPLNIIREKILNECLQKSSDETGIYTLNVPTGGGKTLSSMAFALHHASHHGKKRIIYAIPYTSIIEQTVDVFREIFGDSVIEHHSNLNSEKESRRSRLAAENWDAPIIVTTNVQLFESLFASKTSRARKIHNIANSIIVLDEAQMLPIPFLNPILSLIKELSEAYHVTFVLSTATQPAFSPVKGFGWSFKGLENMREVISEPLSLHEQLKRVEICWPQNPDTSSTWEEIACELKQYQTVLCIVNTRRDCQELFQLMPEGTIHLSGLMCGRHRSEVINYIKEQLKSGKPIRVISTQLVEAGVDIDFPIVFRALAGLDSIAQAAGRCNREGRLKKMGQVRVFIPPRAAPPGLLRQGESIVRVQLRNGRANTLFSPQGFQEYFEQLFWIQGDKLDKEQICRDLKGPDLDFAFRTVAERFQLIENSQLPVLIPYREGQTLVAQLDQGFVDRFIMRKLQRYTVSIPQRLHQELVANGSLRRIGDLELYTITIASMYDQFLGLITSKDFMPDPEDYIF